MKQKEVALSHQRDLGQTCKKLCKDKAHIAQGRLVWRDGITPITESLKHTRQTSARRTDVLLTLPSSYRLCYKISTQYFIS